MSDEKGKVTDKASEIAKNIWLAGVGAYGKAAGEAQERLEKAGMEPPKLFKDLVKAGEALEEEAQEEEAQEEPKPKRSSHSSVEERINKVRENFMMNRPSRSDDVASLHEKVDLLSRKIDILTAALTEQGVIKVPPARKKAAPRKAAAKKAAPKKAAAKKKSATRTKSKAK